ncbi:MAG: STAS domain-containing protein [Alphaproteobacteria bacterium]|nr:STAS domain-containing protein [Alphaproteobacteria bacterium]
MNEPPVASLGDTKGTETVQDGQVALSGRLTINEAETVRDDLLRGLAGCRRLTLDTAELDAVDVAGLQLLIAARRSAAQTGKSLRLAAEPEGALLAALIAAGFRVAGDTGQPDAGQDAFWWGRD